jgi:hypothetical protein
MDQNREVEESKSLFGDDVSSKELERPLHDPREQIGFPQPLLAYYLLSFFSIGIYSIFWAFMHFRKLFEETSKHPILKALLYAFFLPISLAELLGVYERIAIRAGDSLRIPKFPIAFLFFLNHVVTVFAGKSMIGFKIPEETVFITAIISMLLLGVVQREVNRLNRTFCPDLIGDRVVSRKTWIVIAVLGVVVSSMIAFIVLGTILLVIAQEASQ